MSYTISVFKVSIHFNDAGILFVNSFQRHIGEVRWEGRGNTSSDTFWQTFRLLSQNLYSPQSCTYFVWEMDSMCLFNQWLNNRLENKYIYFECSWEDLLLYPFDMIPLTKHSRERTESTDLLGTHSEVMYTISNVQVNTLINSTE